MTYLGMIYDTNTHRWYLDKSYILTECGMDLDTFVKNMFISDTQTAVSQFLKTLSSQIYNYVFSHNMRKRDYLEYLMATDDDARFNLREAMVAQLRYIIRNGKIDELVGVNMTFTTNKSYLPLEEVRGQRALHPDAIDILNAPLHSTGIALTYRGNYITPDFEYRVGY